MSKKTLLFVCYGGGHVNMILPVLQALLARGQYQLQVLALTTAAPVLARAGIASIGFRDLVQPGDEAALAWGRKLGAGLASDLVPQAETEAYLGLSYADLEAEHGVAQGAAIYAERGRHAFLPLRTLRRLLARLRPDLVVATNSPRAERAALLAAGEAGIASLCLLDLYPPADDAWLRRTGFADTLCVLNDSVARLLVANGRDPASVAVTGNPAFDRHYLYQPGAARDGARPVLGLASNILPPAADGRPDGALQREVAERLLALCERRGYTLTLRQHPNEARWQQLGVAVDGSASPIDAWLAGLDLLVTFPSTIALEAQIHGVPVALLDFTALSAASPYLLNGDFALLPSVAALDGLELAPRVRGRGAREPGQSATARVCAQIDQLLDRARKQQDD